MNYTPWTTARIVAIAAMAALGCQARADLKVVSNVTVTGAPNAGQSSAGHDGKSSVTTYYKGSKMRAENGDGAKVTIFDGQTGYVLDPKAKTYYVLDPKGGSSQANGNFTLKPEIKVSKTSDTKTIAGKQSARYSVTGDIKIETSGGGRGGALRGRLGGRGGRSGGSGSMAFQFNGDIWATTDVKTDATSMLQIFASSGLPGGDSIFKQLESQLSNAGLILAGSFKIDPPSIAASRMSQITVSIEAQSLEETTLDDSMFKVPDGYTKVDRPTRSGGRGGF